jgi:hypothetical protein
MFPSLAIPAPSLTQRILDRIRIVPRSALERKPAEVRTQKKSSRQACLPAALAAKTDRYMSVSLSGYVTFSVKFGCGDQNNKAHWKNNSDSYGIKNSKKEYDVV